MTTVRARRRSALAVGLATFAGLICVPSAKADEAASQYSWAPGGSTAGPLPQELLDEMSSCPRQADHPEHFIVCLKIKAYDGTIKIGKNVAHPGDLALTLGVGLDSENNPIIVEGPSGASGGTGSFGAIPLSGGILGVPELDALIDALPAGLLSLSVEPRLGDISVVGSALRFLDWASGVNDDAVTLNVPLSIGLNNTLLGTTCTIGQFSMQLTAKTQGAFDDTVWYENGFPPPNPFNPGRRMRLQIREGTGFQDRSFAVPAASDCGVLGLGKALNDAGLKDLNVFDLVVNSLAGLPAGRGHNYATFKVDTLATSYSSTLGVGDGSWFWSTVDGG